MNTAEQIDCPAPLPEGPATALLTEMLVLAPYKAPEKKVAGTRKGLWRKVMPNASSEDDETHSSPEGEEEEEGAAPSGEDGVPEKADQGAGKGPRRKAVIPTSSEDDEADSSRGGGGKHDEVLPPCTGEEKKRKAAPKGEARMPKKGKASLPDYSTTAAYSEEEWLPRGKPLARS